MPSDEKAIEAMATAAFGDEYTDLLAEARRDFDEPNGQSARLEVEQMHQIMRAALAAYRRHQAEAGIVEVSRGAVGASWHDGSDDASPNNRLREVYAQGKAILAAAQEKDG